MSSIVINSKETQSHQKMTTQNDLIARLLKTQDKLESVAERLQHDRREVRRITMTHINFCDLEFTEEDIRHGEKTFAALLQIYTDILEKINQRIDGIDGAIKLARLKSLNSDTDVWDRRLTYLIGEREMYARALETP